MLFYKLRRKINREVFKNLNYIRVIQKASKIIPGEKVIFVDVSNIALNRYLYSFLKFFHLNGYTVYLPKNKEVIYYLCQDKGEFRFASWLLTEGFVKFGKPPKNNKTIFISAEQLSNDYFLEYFKGSFSSHSYHVPMSEFPLVYSKFPGTKNKIDDNDRLNSVFMAGNLDPSHYYKIGKTKIFEILSRREVADFIYQQPYYFSVSSFQELEKLIKDKIKEKVVLIDTSKDFSIGLDRLKEITENFNFYLALPGVLIPPCHNIIEALSVGCIPVLHKTYAETFLPSLQHGVNAFIYNELQELDELLNSIFDFSRDEVDSVRENVREYYHNYLSAEAVVKNLEQNSFQKIYLLSEDRNLRKNKEQTVEVN